MENSVVSRIAVNDGITVISILPSQKNSRLVYAVLSELADKKINLIAVNGILSNGEITIAVKENDLCEILKVLNRKKTFIAVNGSNSKISIFGQNLDRCDFLVKKVLDPLSEYNSDIRIVTAAQHEISLIMPTYKTEPFLSEFTKSDIIF